MKYNKKALSFDEQANLLISRGMGIDDLQKLTNYLSNVNYYRLSGYWYIFKDKPKQGQERFLPNTCFNYIQDRYEFDRKLRLLVLDAIERIEVSIFRTRMVEKYTLRYGPFGYTVLENYNPRFPPYEFHKLMNEILNDEKRSHEEFITRYHDKYSNEKYLPLWMSAEIMSFGQLLTIFRNLSINIKQEISHEFNLFPMVLDSWLLSLNTIRNSCAHHVRLWNRPLGNPIKIPDKKHDPRWYSPIIVPENRLFTILTIVQYLLGYIVVENHWQTSLNALLNEYPTIPLIPMGFPENWQECPLWKNK